MDENKIALYKKLSEALANNNRGDIMSAIAKIRELSSTTEGFTEELHITMHWNPDACRVISGTLNALNQALDYLGQAI